MNIFEKCPSCGSMWAKLKTLPNGRWASDPEAVYVASCGTCGRMVCPDCSDVHALESEKGN